MPLDRQENQLTQLQTNFQNTTQTIIFKLGAIESALSDMKSAQLMQSAAGNTFAVDMQKRVGSLERSRSYIYGMMFIVSMVVSAVITYFRYFIGAMPIK